MQNAFQADKALRSISLVFLTAGICALLFPTENATDLLSYDATYLLSVAAGAVFIHTASRLNNLLIEKTYLPHAASLTLLLCAIICSASTFPLSSQASLAFGLLAATCAIVSHVSAIEDVTFVQQRTIVCLSVLIGILLFLFTELISKALGTTVNKSILAVIFLAVQTIVSFASRKTVATSSLQLPSNAERRYDTSVHFGAPLADGFLLGYLPASLSVGHVEISIPTLICAILVGILFLLVSRYEESLPRQAFLGAESAEQTQKRRAGFLKAVPIALSLLFGASPIIDALIVGIYFTISTWYLSLLCSSLTERAKLLNISIFAILGRFGATAIFSFLVAGIICIAPNYFGLSDMIANEIRVVLGILILEGFCVMSSKKGTMHDAIEEVKGATEGKQRAHWRDRVDSIAQAYDLTSRQQEVFLLLAHGRNAQFIADELCVSLPTAKSHIYNIYMKMGIHSHQELLDLVDLRSEETTNQQEESNNSLLFGARGQ